MGIGEACVTIADVQWDVFLPAFVSARPSPLLSDLPKARAALDGNGIPGKSGTSLQLAEETGTAEAGLRQRLERMTATERRAWFLSTVITEVASVLGDSTFDDIEADRAFKDSVSTRSPRGAAQSLGGVGIRPPPPWSSTIRRPSSSPRTHLESALNRAGDEADLRRPRRQGTSDEPMAIVGMGCRFPGGVDTPEELWQLVGRGRDAMTEFPDDRGWDLEALYDPEPGRTGQELPTAGGFLRRGRSSTPTSSASALVRPWRWTPSSASSWKPPGKPSNAPASTRRLARHRHRCVRRRDRPGLRPGCRAPEAPRATSSPATPPASPRAGSRTSFGLEGPAVTHRHRLLLVTRRPAPGRPGSAQRRMRPRAGRRRHHHVHPRHVHRVQPPAGPRRRRPVQGVRRRRRRHRLGRGRRPGRAGTLSRRPPQRPPGPRHHPGLRDQPGRRQQRPDRPQRPLTGTRHPPSPRQRRARTRPTSTPSRPTAPEHASATPSKHKPSSPPTAKTAPEHPLPWLDQVQHRPHPSRRRRRRHHQDGPGHAARRAAADPPRRRADP